MWSRENLYKLWDNLVHTYAKCDITDFSDRLVAIVGLARAFGGLLRIQSSEYMYGMWYTRLEREFMWCRQKYPEQGSRPLEDAMPSWSWLSVAQGIMPFSLFHLANPYTTASKPRMEVLSFDTLSGSRDTNAYMNMARLRAPLCKATVFEIEKGGFGSKQNHRIEVGKVILKEPKNSYSVWDEGPTDSPVYLMLGFVYEKAEQSREPTQTVSTRQGLQAQRGEHDDIGKASNRVYYCLILSPIEPKACFRRIGFIQFDFVSNTPMHEQDDVQRSQDMEALENEFRVDDVPHYLYEELDNDLRCTFNLV